MWYKRIKDTLREKISGKKLDLNTEYYILIGSSIRINGKYRWSIPSYVTYSGMPNIGSFALSVRNTMLYFPKAQYLIDILGYTFQIVDVGATLIILKSIRENI
jgi:hypothetical protein